MGENEKNALEQARNNVERHILQQIQKNGLRNAELRSQPKADERLGELVKGFHNNEYDRVGAVHEDTLKTQVKVYKDGGAIPDNMTPEHKEAFALEYAMTTPPNPLDPQTPLSEAQKHPHYMQAMEDIRAFEATALQATASAGVTSQTVDQLLVRYKGNENDHEGTTGLNQRVFENMDGDLRWSSARGNSEIREARALSNALKDGKNPLSPNASLEEAQNHPAYLETMKYLTPTAYERLDDLVSGYHGDNNDPGLIPEGMVRLVAEKVKDVQNAGGEQDALKGALGSLEDNYNPQELQESVALWNAMHDEKNPLDNEASLEDAQNHPAYKEAMAVMNPDLNPKAGMAVEAGISVGTSPSPMKMKP